MKTMAIFGQDCSACNSVIHLLFFGNTLYKLQAYIKHHFLTDFLE